MVDDALQHITVQFLKRKSHATQKVIEYMAYLKARGKSPCSIRVNCRSEFVNETLMKYSSTQGIVLQMTALYSPSQNGVAKRMNCTLVELACTILAASKLPEFLWELAIEHIAYVRNFVFTHAQLDMTPYQAWHGIKPDVSHLCEFGTPVWILQQGPNICHKMLPKSERRAYVSYNNGSKAIKYYNAAMRNIPTSRNFKFLNRDTLPPPDEIEIDPPSQGESSLSEGEREGADTWSEQSIS